MASVVSELPGCSKNAVSSPPPRGESHGSGPALIDEAELSSGRGIVIAAGMGLAFWIVVGAGIWSWVLR